MADRTTKSPSPAAKSSSPAGKSPSPVTKSPSSAAKSPGSSSPAGALPVDDQEQNLLEADDNAESILGESVNNLSTSSVTSSILNYRMINGRRYHSDVGNAAYWASNDDKQNESLDLNHHTLTILTGGKLYLAPLEKDKIHKVLDIGTGTGLWAIDFADDFPEAEVIGTDISPIQTSWVPPNLKFEIEDCTLPWTFGDNSVDYVHMRWLVGSIADWDALFAEAFKTLRPGGWIESFEARMQVDSDHGPIPEDAYIQQSSRFFLDGGEKIGRTFYVWDHELQRKGMEKAGFVDLQEVELKASGRPLGNWPKDPVYKEAGIISQIILEEDAEGFILFLANTLGWSREEVQVYLSHLRAEIRSNKYYPYYKQRVIWGRKPE